MKIHLFYNYVFMFSSPNIFFTVIPKCTMVLGISQPTQVYSIGMGELNLYTICQKRRHRIKNNCKQTKRHIRNTSLLRYLFWLKFLFFFFFFFFFIIVSVSYSIFYMSSEVYLTSWHQLFIVTTIFSSLTLHFL